MRCETFHVDHVRELGLEPAEFERQAHAGNAYTLRRVDGTIVACGGICESRFGPHLWSLTAPGVSAVALHRAVLRFIGMFSHLTLHATTDGAAASCRWLERLGFVRAAPTDEPGVAGHLLYVREATV
jgi:hypothetical protein